MKDHGADYTRGMAPSIKQVKPDDETLEEEWIRDVDYNDPGGAGASKRRTGGAWVWTVYVDAAELVIEEPLESELREAVEAALRGVAGVTAVEADAENRELWLVSGTPKGDALVAAVGGVVDAMGDRIRAYVESM